MHILFLSGFIWRLFFRLAIYPGKAIWFYALWSSLDLSYWDLKNILFLSCRMKRVPWNLSEALFRVPSSLSLSARVIMLPSHFFWVHVTLTCCLFVCSMHWFETDSFLPSFSHFEQNWSLIISLNLNSLCVMSFINWPDFYLHLFINLTTCHQILPRLKKALCVSKWWPYPYIKLSWQIQKIISPHVQIFSSSRFAHPDSTITNNDLGTCSGDRSWYSYHYHCCCVLYHLVPGLQKFVKTLTLLSAWPASSCYSDPGLCSDSQDQPGDHNFHNHRWQLHPSHRIHGPVSIGLSDNWRIHFSDECIHLQKGQKRCSFCFRDARRVRGGIRKTCGSASPKPSRTGK